MADAAPGHPEILRIVAPNPGPMTLAGTNTYVVGAGPTYVIDPGPDDAGHREAIRAAAAGPIAGVLLTHGHSDHTAGVEALDAPLLWGEVGSGDEAAAIMAALEDAATAPPASAAKAEIEVAESRTVGPFIVIPTPGHAADHVAFFIEGVCFCGDLVLGEGSTIVPPAAVGGSLGDYLDSLRRLAGLDAELLAPGHGPWINDPGQRIAEYAEHREERERRLVAELEAGERSRERLLELVWDDVPEPLRPAAALAMQAHLEKLESEERWRSLAGELR